MRGGVVPYRGSVHAATASAFRDASAAVFFFREGWCHPVSDGVLMSREEYSAWVDWVDSDTGLRRGTSRHRIRVEKDTGAVVERGASPRFFEMSLNCDKSLIVAALLSTDVATALMSALERSATVLRSYLFTSSTTRVGGRAGQRTVPVETMEFCQIPGTENRDGEPFWYIRMQIGARVYAEKKWRGLASSVLLHQIKTFHHLSELVLSSDEGLREALAKGGFFFDAGGCSVPELREHAKLISERSTQIGKLAAQLDQEELREHATKNKKYLSSLRASRALRSGSADRPARVTSWVEFFRDAQLPTSGTSHHISSAVGFAGLDIEALARESLAAISANHSQFSVVMLQAEVAHQLRLLDRILTTVEVMDVYKIATGVALRVCDSVLPIDAQDTVTLATKHLTVPATGGVH